MADDARLVGLRPWLPMAIIVAVLFGNACAARLRTTAWTSPMEGPALPGLATSLPTPPENEVQEAQAARLALQISTLPSIPSAAVSGLAYQNLYMRYVNPFHKVAEYEQGVQMRVVDGAVYYKPAPPEVIARSAVGDFTGTDVFQLWMISAAHALTMVAAAVTDHPGVPPVDFTIQFGDFCRDADGSTGAETMGWSPTPGLDEAEMMSGDPTSFTPAWFKDRGQPAAPLPPVFSWNARPGCNVVNTPGYDWLFFNQNFVEGSQWRFDSHKGLPWQQRKAKLFWRGSVMSWDGSRARALRLGMIHSDILDIKVPASTTTRTMATQDICDMYVKDLAKGGAGVPHAALQDCDPYGGRHIFGTHLAGIEEQMAYKFILDMDGGSSTWRVKNVLTSGSLLFKVVHKQNGTSQFFFDDLRPMEHYVPVSFENLETDLPAKVRWALAHDNECRRIAENAKLFAQQHLRTKDALWHVHAALTLYARNLQTYVPTKPSAKEEPEFALLCCEDLKLLPGIGAPLAAQCKMNPSVEKKCKERPPYSGWFAGGGILLGKGKEAAERQTPPPETSPLPTTTTPLPTTTPMTFSTTMNPNYLALLRYR